MYKLEHIGIAVKDLQKSNQLFELLLGIGHFKTETVGSEGVTTSFFQTGESKIELLESHMEGSAIGRFIEKRGEGIHHIAFEVPNIRKEMHRLREEGFQLLSNHPFRGADNKWVCFIHPKSANGVLVELCQSIPEEEE
ncbi:MAG: methylmalonyl-CoA epimerase [Saprospiraceae bacterium]|nr:methylmalonyl-CoA epimerase [Saprospiraceae bacterium]